MDSCLEAKGLDHGSVRGRWVDKLLRKLAQGLTWRGVLMDISSVAQRGREAQEIFGVWTTAYILCNLSMKYILG